MKMFKLINNTWGYSQKSKIKLAILNVQKSILWKYAQLCQFILNKQKAQNKNTLMKQFFFRSTEKKCFGSTEKNARTVSGEKSRMI